MLGGPNRKLALVDFAGTLVSENLEGGRFTRAPRKGSEVVLLPRVLEGISFLQEKDYLVVVVSNRSDVASGEVTLEQVHDVHQAFNDLLYLSKLAEIDAYYFCPHNNSHRCYCRKPRPGLLKTAMREMQVEPERCVMIGNDPRDREAGLAAGIWCKQVSEAGPQFRGFFEEAKSVVEEHERRILCHTETS